MLHTRVDNLRLDITQWMILINRLNNVTLDITPGMILINRLTNQTLYIAQWIISDQQSESSDIGYHSMNDSDKQIK